jgi:hypothetical protein
MARAPSQISSPRASLSELRTSRGAFAQRGRTLTTNLRTILRLREQQLQIEVEEQADRIWLGLQGSACEYVIRNRSSRATRVAPLCALPKDLIAWLGLQEVWDIQTGPRPLIFRQLGLTIHFGYVGDTVKPQALRLEVAWRARLDRCWTRLSSAWRRPSALASRHP